MTTTITPSLGHAPLFTQGGVGQTPGYDAIDLRRTLLVNPLQEGAVEAGAYKVTQRAAGANMSVDIAANGGSCVIQGDHVNQQGPYPVPAHSAVINEVVGAAHATLPRIDQVVLELQDNTHDSSGGNQARTRVIAGTATSGATLDNRLGAAALPSSCMRLADVLVPAAASSLTTAANIRDRRQWARGAYRKLTRNANDASGSNYGPAPSSLASIGTTLQSRIECSGAPMRLSLRGRFTTNTANARMWLAALIDGAIAETGSEVSVRGPLASNEDGFSIGWDFTPAAGSHIIAPGWRTDSGVDTRILASGTYAVQVVIQEFAGQPTASND